MRFMVIVKATRDSEAGKMPSEDMLGAMAKFNEEMVKAGIMLDGAGLQSSAKGARIRFEGGKRRVIDGPFAETKELIAGYWIIQVKNKAEAIEWMKRCPNPYEEDGEIELRQFFELEDFGESPAVDHHLRQKGILKASDSLGPTSKGTRVQVRDGKRSLVDGPFAEAKEIVGGFFLLDCSKDEAIAAATTCPAAEFATIEVREVGPCWEK